MAARVEALCIIVALLALPACATSPQPVPTTYTGNTTAFSIETPTWRYESLRHTVKTPQGKKVYTVKDGYTYGK